MSLMKRVMEAKHQKTNVELTFEEKRQAWLEAAHLALKSPPSPPAQPTVSERTQRIRDQQGPMRTKTEAIATVARILTPALTPRGSCRAVNVDTGRQCALLGGHAGVHRHGRTEFIRTAALGQTSFARRDALDGLASSRHGSSFTTPATGD